MQSNFNASPEANLYFDRYFNCNAVKILPGEFYATSNNHLIVTVLGSCIATCLFDPINNVRGMNHFLLPRDDMEKSALLCESARYGTYAMELLINEMLKLGAKKNQIVAKVFGGGNVMKGLIHNNIGQKNVPWLAATNNNPTNCTVHVKDVSVKVSAINRIPITPPLCSCLLLN